MGATTSTIFSFLSSKYKYNGGSIAKIACAEDIPPSHRIIGKMQKVKQNPLLQEDFCYFLVHKKGKISCLKLFQDYENVRNQLLNSPDNVNCLPNGQINIADVDIPSHDAYTKSTDDFEIRFLLRTSLHQLQKLKALNTTYISINTVYKQLVAAEDILLQSILEDFEEFVAMAPLPPPLSRQPTNRTAQMLAMLPSKREKEGNPNNPKDNGCSSEKGEEECEELCHCDDKSDCEHSACDHHDEADSEIMRIDEIMQNEQRLFLHSFSTSGKTHLFDPSSLHPLSVCPDCNPNPNPYSPIPNHPSSNDNNNVHSFHSVSSDSNLHRNNNEVDCNKGEDTYQNNLSVITTDSATVTIDGNSMVSPSPQRIRPPTVATVLVPVRIVPAVR